MVGGSNNSASLRTEIISAMSGVGLDLTPDILSQCLALATNRRMSATELADAWDAHSLNAKVTELNELTFAAYRNALVKVSPEGAVQTRPALGKRQTGTGPSAMLVSPSPTKRSNKNHKDGLSAVDALIADDSARVSLSPSSKKNVIPRTPTPKKVPIKLPLFSERPNVGSVVATYNPHKLPALEQKDGAATRLCDVEYDQFDTNVMGPYRYMFSPLEDRVKALDDRILEMGEEMQEKFGLKAKETNDTNTNDDNNGDEVAPIQAVGVPGQDGVCCIGRICNEAHEGKLNDSSILLEGSHDFSGGRRVHLDVSKLTTGFSLFPGQIVAVEGINAYGGKMTAQRICEGSSHEPLKTSAKQLLKLHHDTDHQNGQGLKIMSMSGPYTTSDNLDYEPLTAALEEILMQKPDVVIMTGPFVDVTHKSIQQGKVELKLEGDEVMTVTHEALFLYMISDRLRDLYEISDENGEECKTQFVLVPSLDDAIAEPVFPQPGLSDRLPNGGKVVKLPDSDMEIELGTLGLQHVEVQGRSGPVKNLKRRVHCVSNPCTLQINEVTIGITSTDTLLHMFANETHGNLPRPPISTNGAVSVSPVTTRVAQHLLQQRSFYPMFPAPASCNMSANLDLAHMKQWSMPCKPDVLITPSKQKPFAMQVLDSTVVINPGPLTWGTTGGAFAIMDVHPMKRETLESATEANLELEHNIQDRIRVEIKRI